MADTPIKWSIDADYIQGCNCDYGCPCEFEAPPTMGYCNGIGAWHINKGNYGDVSLDGLGLGYSLHAPGSLHEGNITMAAFVDEKASPEQREALLAIATGSQGGLPFEIIASLVSNMLEPQFVPFDFNLNGKNSSVKMGESTTVACEPIKNPVTGEPEGIRVEHDTGFIFKGADVVAARECQTSLPGLSFSWPNKAGFVTQVQYAN